MAPVAELDSVGSLLPDRSLVTYATMAGSTAEVAERVAAVLRQRGMAVEVLPMDQVDNVDMYQAVVIGAPMIMGWHRRARTFLKRHRKALARLPHALFITAMTLTDSGPIQMEGVPLFVDPQLLKPPVRSGRLSLRERYAQLSNYLRPILRLTRPASIGMFAGRLEYGRLPRWAVVFAMLVVQAPAGDRRDWQAIEAWAAGLPGLLGQTNTEPAQQVPVHAPSI